MIKRIFILCLSILIIGYLAVAITAMNRKPDNELCKGMELTVKDSVDYGYITPKGIKNILKSVWETSTYVPWKRLLTTILSFRKQNVILLLEERYMWRSTNEYLCYEL